MTKPVGRPKGLLNQKITDEEVAEMRQMRNSGYFVKDLALKYNLSLSRVSRICVGIDRASAGGPFVRRRMKRKEKNED